MSGRQPCGVCRDDGLHGDMMPDPLVKMYWQPNLHEPRMVMAFSGWMDGGETSTGTIEYLVRKLDATKLAEIIPDQFYIYNLPGSMEVSALFRPHTDIKDGLITAYQEPTNTFFCSNEHNLLLFSGKEPNLRWKEYADCVLSTAVEFNVRTIFFIGSVAGLVPHSRDPEFHGSVSDESLKPFLQQHGIKFSNYRGPASLVTFLMLLARQNGLQMATIVAEIPAYVEGRNVKSIEASTRKLASMLGLSVDLDELHVMSERFEQSMTKLVEGRPELAEHIRKMEDAYDNEVLTSEMGDLKAWLEQQGLRLD